MQVAHVSWVFCFFATEKIGTWMLCRTRDDSFCCLQTVLILLIYTIS